MYFRIFTPHPTLHPTPLFSTSLLDNKASPNKRGIVPNFASMKTHFLAKFWLLLKLDPAIFANLVWLASLDQHLFVLFLFFSFFPPTENKLLCHPLIFFSTLSSTSLNKPFYFLVSPPLMVISRVRKNNEYFINGGEDKTG